MEARRRGRGAQRVAIPVCAFSGPAGTGGFADGAREEIREGVHAAQHV